ncbi:CDP-alcohol phosphatidyltransferase family protein [Nocardiopsis ansamitocini]|uniref:Phosphatidylglycerophosphate synthase n=1 Tax=Nocardiopsis ansamitocini TaxID=1670832 RepID=A0A9W6UGJ9_9ACTN|nr:CDP-alcohol phosphatidyltransferase family protein [Nocardiopsis ansamitocini]GLU47626.1 hypothetical protein Nans01_19770 [Nocardiopsis ansamitocini]
MSSFTMDEVRNRTRKERDSWWTVWAIDPIALRLVRLIANRTSITPNQLTVVVLLLGLGAAACFAVGFWPFLIAGAVLYYVSFLVDCMDGKLARLTDRESLFGSWMDYIFDRFRVLMCAVALMGGQYVLTGRTVFVWMALVVVFCDMLRYLNALQVYKMRREMRSYLAAALERARATLSMLEPAQPGAPLSDTGEQAVLKHGISVLEQLLRSQAEKENRYDRDAGKQPDVQLPKVDLHQEFRHRFPWYQRFWEFLRAHRIRTHLVSGIELQIAVFVLAPLLAVFAPSAIVWTTVLAGVLLLAFEILIVYKLWLSTRDFFRVVDGIEGALSFARTPERQAGGETPAADSSQATLR